MEMAALILNLGAGSAREYFSHEPWQIWIVQWVNLKEEKFLQLLTCQILKGTKNELFNIRMGIPEMQELWLDLKEKYRSGNIKKRRKNSCIKTGERL